MSFVGESNKHPDNIQLLSRIGNVLPSNIFATPLILRDRIAAVVYADSGDGSDQLHDSEALEILTAYASKLLDALSAQKSPMKTGEHVPPPAAPPPTPAPAMRAQAEEEDSGTVMFANAEMNVSSFGGPAAASAGPAPAAPAATGPDLDSMDSDMRKKHEEAMRFARLLVSEIKLYNEAKVQQGRSNNGIYNLMRDDIERSRQLYKERVPEPIRSRTNYFNDELIRILADGDSGAMGQSLPAS